MRAYIKTILICFFLTVTLPLGAQDTDIPLAPVLDLVTVEPSTGHTTLLWSAGGSPDVAGYIIYLYINQEGYAIDTVYRPEARSYTNTKSNAAYYSESYVIAAIDSSDNISPLSNFLNTVYLQGQLDTCGHNIDLQWKGYITEPPSVSEYRIYYSRDGSEYSLEAITGSSDTAYNKDNFDSYSEYCFYVEAVLPGGLSSHSNTFCIQTMLPRPPEWINADYASYNDEGEVNLSFTTDPASEMRKFRIERSTDSLSGHEIIYEGSHSNPHIEYTDNDPPEGVNYYRMSALNSCNEPVVHSNYASAINLNISEENELIRLQWTGYYNWLGGIASYRVMRNNRGFYEEIAILGSTDTSYTDNIRDFLYETDQEDICYRIIAEEGPNPYIQGASSTSVTRCIRQPVNIHMPNAFTPDNNNMNDIFMPLISFTPRDYRMIIKTRTGKTVFETDDHLQGWDGRHGSKKMPQDVYIWLLRVETPEGKTINKTGTVTIIFNQDSP
ncbi:MAG: gliding motility-associated C-terminal domain-containing protein [Bacteroidales bacterium]